MDALVGKTARYTGPGMADHGKTGTLFVGQDYDLYNGESRGPALMIDFGDYAIYCEPHEIEFV